MVSVRPAVTLALFLAASALADTPAKRLTIVLEFEGSYSAQSVTSMKREVEKVFHNAPLRLEWVARAGAENGIWGRLAVVRFQGKCLYESGITAARETEALAVTHVSNGSVLPFSDVACERIAALVEPAIRGSDTARADMLFGRALGRVVAHELVHILSGSVAHGREGVVERALSADQLTCDELSLGSLHH